MPPAIWRTASNSDAPAEFSDRFTSITFDAFTKNLVDRFHTAIPAEWRPTKPYEIAFWDYKSTNYWLTRARLAAPEPWKAEIEEIGPSSFEGRTVGARRMLVPHPEPRSGAEFATTRWWSEQRGAGDPSNLTFVTLNRMAELLLRSNPQIANALRATYPFIFVDEFQDTTFAQYDFLYSVFRGSSARYHRRRRRQNKGSWAGPARDQTPSPDWKQTSTLCGCRCSSTFVLHRISSPSSMSSHAPSTHRRHRSLPRQANLSTATWPRFGTARHALKKRAISRRGWLAT